jgi:hypothetical protein
MSTEKTSATLVYQATEPKGAGAMRTSLKTSTDVLRLLGKVVRQLEADEIDANKARAIIYAASTAGQLIKAVDLEQRIDDLEQSIDPQRKAG